MKKSIGMENTTLVRDARNARRPATAAAGLAWPPPAAATAEAITIFCFGQITAQTFKNISVPNRAPVKMASPQGLVMTDAPGGAWSTRFVMIAAPERKVNIAPHRNHHSARGTSVRVAALFVAPSASAKNGPCTKVQDE